MLDYNPSSGEIEIFNSIPAHYQKLLRPGAEFTHIKVDFADLVFQRITGDGFDIHCGFTDGKGNGWIKARGEETALELRIALEGQLEGEWDGILSPLLLPYFCNISYTPHISTRAVFREGRKCKWVDIQFRKPYLHKFAEDYPEFKFFLDAIFRKSPIQLGRQDFPCTLEMKRIVNRILNSPYHQKLEKKVLPALVNLLLVEVFQMAFHNTEQQNIIITPERRERLYAAYSFLMSPGDHGPVSNDELCMMFGLSERILLKGFNELFNDTPHKIAKESRFLEAEKLLMQGYSPSDVYQVAGYRDLSNFCVAFSVRNKCTPLEYQKKNARRLRL